MLICVDEATGYFAFFRKKARRSASILLGVAYNKGNGDVLRRRTRFANGKRAGARRFSETPKTPIDKENDQ